MVLLLNGCSKEDMLSKFASPEDQARAKSYLSQIHNHDFSAIERDIDPSLKSVITPDLLEKMANFTPTGDPTSIKLVGAQENNSPGSRSINITFEYDWGDKWFIENLAVREKDGVNTVIGLHVFSIPKSMEEQNKFTLGGKTVVQYAILVAAVGAVVLTLYALVACIRTKHLRRKWLWVLFILVGFGSVGVNWTTGQTGYQILQIKLFSAGAAAEFYGPWIITLGIPVGAIWFLLRRRQGRLKINAPQPASGAAQSGS